MEFALVVIPLVLLTLGIIEFGWLFNGQITVTASAREGARVAAVRGDDEQVEEAVEKHISGSALTLQNVQVDRPPDSENVTVSVTGMIDPLVGFFVRNTMQLTARAVMRRE